MNKYILLAGTVFMTFVFAYCLPFTFSHPTTSNIIITLVTGGITIIGFWMFATHGKKKTETVVVNSQALTPVD